MLARDWYYTQRRQVGLDTAVASIYDVSEDSDVRARQALTMLGARPGWRIADIGCGNGVLATEVATNGALTLDAGVPGGTSFVRAEVKRGSTMLALTNPIFLS